MLVHSSVEIYKTALYGATLNCYCPCRQLYIFLRNNQDIGKAISDTVETLERSGGKDAFGHIKHCIPTCERDALCTSCITSFVYSPTSERQHHNFVTFRVYGAYVSAGVNQYGVHHNTKGVHIYVKAKLICENKTAARLGIILHSQGDNPHVRQSNVLLLLPRYPLPPGTHTAHNGIRRGFAAKPPAQREVACS